MDKESAASRRHSMLVVSRCVLFAVLAILYGPPAATAGDGWILE